MRKSRLEGLTVGLLIVAVVVMGGVVVSSLFSSRSANDTPRTALERRIFDSEMAVEQQPGSFNARADLAAALAAAGRYSDALKQLDQAQRIEPDNSEISKLRGAIYAKMGKRVEAVKWLKKAAAAEGMLADYYAEIYADLAEVYEAGKDYKSAIKAYERALNYSPISTTFYLGLGRAYEKNGDLEKAWGAYQVASEMDTQDEESLAAVKRLEKILSKKDDKKK
jgi:tetratricopeptide (TPR) repeat protein